MFYGRLTFTLPAAWKHRTHGYSLWSRRIQWNLLLQQYRLIARAHHCLEGESLRGKNAIIHLPCTSSKLKFFQNPTKLLVLLSLQVTEFILTYIQRKQQSAFSISYVPGKQKKQRRKTSSLALRDHHLFVLWYVCLEFSSVMGFLMSFLSYQFDITWRWAFYYWFALELVKNRFWRP